MIKLSKAGIPNVHEHNILQDHVLGSTLRLVSAHTFCFVDYYFSDLIWLAHKKKLKISDD